MSEQKESDFLDISKNPYIPKPDDYFEGYNKSIEENFDPKRMEYSKLTHQLFTTVGGKQWLEQTKLYLADRAVDLGSKNAALQMASLQGSRAMVTTIEQHIEVFEQHLQGT